MSKDCAVCDSLREKVKNLEFVLGLYHERLTSLVEACESAQFTDALGVEDAINDAKAIMPKI